MKHSFINYMCGAFSLLLSAGLAGCEDTYKVAPLAEVVDLTMTVDNNNLAMGETMYITFDVTDKESQTANEEFDIKLNVTANGLEDATTLFENFPSAIVFGKGESSSQERRNLRFLCRQSERFRTRIYNRQCFAERTGGRLPLYDNLSEE